MNFFVRMSPTKGAKMKGFIEKLHSTISIDVLSEITNGKDLGVITIRNIHNFPNVPTVVQFVFMEDELHIYLFVCEIVIFDLFDLYRKQVEYMIELAEMFGYKRAGEIIEYNDSKSLLNNKSF